MKVKAKKITPLQLKLIDGFLTLFGCGKIKNAPGTFASFMTILFWFCMTILFAKTRVPIFYETMFWSIIIIFSTIFAIMFIPIYSRNFTEDDHPSIVIDEFVGQLLALCLTYPFVRDYYHEENWLLTKIVMFAHMLLCFLFFRTLDIAKPWVIGWIDRNIKNPFGVMIDDIVAGVMAAVFNIAIYLFYKSSILQLHGY